MTILMPYKQCTHEGPHQVGLHHMLAGHTPINALIRAALGSAGPDDFDGGHDELDTLTAKAVAALERPGDADGFTYLTSDELEPLWLVLAAGLEYMAANNYADDYDPESADAEECLAALELGATPAFALACWAN